MRGLACAVATAASVPLLMVVAAAAAVVKRRGACRAPVNGHPLPLTQQLLDHEAEAVYVDRRLRGPAVLHFGRAVLFGAHGAAQPLIRILRQATRGGGAVNERALGQTSWAERRLDLRPGFLSGRQASSSRLVHVARQAKVDEQRAVVGGDEHVPRLQVAVNDAERVEPHQRARHAREDVDRIGVPDDAI